MISKTWFRSLMKSDDDTAPIASMSASGGDDEADFKQGRPADEDEQNLPNVFDDQNDDDDSGVEAHHLRSEESVIVEPAREQKPVETRREATSRGSKKAQDVDSSSDDEEESAREQLTEGEDDPLAPAYCLEDGELMDEDDIQDRPKSLPWSSRIQQSREFFNSELLYRFDLLAREEREQLKGSYRIEVKGSQGGTWTLKLDNSLEIVPEREDADVVFTCQQKDFLALVNGELNPQLALLAQKVRYTGDVRRAVLFQSLLVPAGV